MLSTLRNNSLYNLPPPSLSQLSSAGWADSLALTGRFEYERVGWWRGRAAPWLQDNGCQNWEYATFFMIPRYRPIFRILERILSTWGEVVRCRDRSCQGVDRRKVEHHLYYDLNNFCCHGDCWLCHLASKWRTQPTVIIMIIHFI